MRYYLVAMDTVGIQDYLFGSNRLKENIGASELVFRVTQQWVYETIEQTLHLRHNLKTPLDALAEDLFKEEQILESDRLDVEVLYAGGGNAVLMFADVEIARKFVRCLSEKVITDAPGLNVVFACRSFDPQEPLSQAYDHLMKELGRRKAARLPSAPLLGVSVTATCQSTGLPAVDDDDNRRLISAEIAAKLASEEKAGDRLERWFEVEKRGYRFVRDFNLLGTHMAVVHADGNRIGQRIEKIIETYNTTEQNPKFIKTMRSFSQSLKRISVKAARHIIDRLLDEVSKERGKIPIQGSLLPFRPLVVGGDDTTFVCRGDLGLTLATLYLQAFNRETIDDGLDLAAHACAGIAIVHARYPFARAYELSESLCSEAKYYIRQEKGTSSENDLSALDWHFGVNGLLKDLSDIRREEYTVKQGRLTIRPLRLSNPQNDWVSSWQTFREVTTTFQRDWADKRNKLKTLREVLRAGPEATAQFLNAYELQLPHIREYSYDFQKTGWRSPDGGVCGYFDAIEAADHFIDLEENNE